MKRLLLVILGAAALLAGCAVDNEIKAGERRYIREVTYELDGQPHTIRRAVTCVYQSTALSEADGHFHARWAIQEPRFVGIDIGDGLLLSFDSEVSCQGFPPGGDPATHTDEIEVIDCNYSSTENDHMFFGTTKKAFLGTKWVQITNSTYRQRTPADRPDQETPESAFMQTPDLWRGETRGAAAAACAGRRR
jgi:hypothetical protein